MVLSTNLFIKVIFKLTVTISNLCFTDSPLTDCQIVFCVVVEFTNWTQHPTYPLKQFHFLAAPLLIFRLILLLKHSDLKLRHNSFEYGARFLWKEISLNFTIKAVGVCLKNKRNFSKNKIKMLKVTSSGYRSLLDTILATKNS